MSTAETDVIVQRKSESEVTQATQLETYLLNGSVRGQKHSRKHVKPIVRFAANKDRPECARAIVRLRNVSEHPLYFKFKCEVDANIIAHPAGNGVVAPHSTHEFRLSWHRPPEISTWTNVRPSRLAVITNFFSGADFTDGRKCTTKLVGNITDAEQVSGDRPPATRLTFDLEGTTAVSSCHTPQEESRQEPMVLFYNRLTEWVQLHPMNVIVAVVIVVMVVAFALCFR
ncbi:hypothetical protein Tcan_03305 [Toxocara canis]|uniref:MSP domain-containing protein n=1 Tax=Toxocara canis TaxID=6265 RepID=A0A0B2W4M1_TOXCA|nr:hypothetical protein Tcan_03305 [Toxocara canis]